MQMIPSTPHATESRAELRIFDYLRGAFANDAALGLTAFHSLNLTRHQTKRFGEIDFLIVGKPGIFVLGDQGGGISSVRVIFMRSQRATQAQLRR